MQGEDWFTLFFPILCNGILLFLFAKLIEIKKKCKQQAQDAHQKTVYEFLNVIQNILRNFCTENENSFLPSLNETLPLFFSFCMKNKERLQEYIQNINSTEKVWNQMVEVLHFVQENENGIINGECAQKVSFLNHKLFDVLVETSQMCISDIYEKGTM